ncbi:MAG: MerR family DNA-binding protein [Actinomycetota bacterium]|nr:MerR family DNA-binding protein [Actinomycetota bacterium]
MFYLEGAKVLKQLGFGLEEIAELGRFALTGASASSRTQAILQQKQTELSRRIRVLDGLHELVRDAASEHRADEWPVTDLLVWAGTESGSTTA